MIVAIDGPAGAGKSTVARSVAAALGLRFLDTGAMYRAVTKVVLDRGIDPNDGPACGDVAAGLVLAFDADGRILINGDPGEPAIRAQDVTGAVSAVSAHPEVRRAVVPLQRMEGERGHGIVAEGRDIGTVVFPDADHKFFLTASSRERARRRAAQDGREDEVAALQAEIERRDELDTTRADSPLKQASDAIAVDTDRLDLAGVVQRVLEAIRQRASTESGEVRS